METAEFMPLLGIGIAFVVIIIWRAHATRKKMALIAELPKLGSREELDDVLAAYGRREGWIGTVAVAVALLGGVWASWIGDLASAPEPGARIAISSGALVLAAAVGHGLTRLEALIAAKVYAATGD
jgi:hypothetical protein